MTLEEDSLRILLLPDQRDQNNMNTVIINDYTIEYEATLLRSKSFHIHFHVNWVL